MVHGWLSNLNALLTKKWRKFLSRLKEMSGVRENMCLVSGSSRRILKFLGMTFLIARFNLWMVGKGEWNSVDFFVL